MPEVIRAVKSTRAAEADLDAAGIIALVEPTPECLNDWSDVAVRYWSSYPDEIDAWIREAAAFEAEALAASERHQDLLGP